MKKTIITCAWGIMACCSNDITRQDNNTRSPILINGADTIVYLNRFQNLIQGNWTYADDTTVLLAINLPKATFITGGQGDPDSSDVEISMSNCNTSAAYEPAAQLLVNGPVVYMRTVTPTRHGLSTRNQCYAILFIDEKHLTLLTTDNGYLIEFRR